MYLICLHSHFNAWRPSLHPLPSPVKVSFPNSWQHTLICCQHFGVIYKVSMAFQLRAPAERAPGKVEALSLFFPLFTLLHLHRGCQSVSITRGEMNHSERSADLRPEFWESGLMSALASPVPDKQSPPKFTHRTLASELITCCLWCMVEL